MRERPCESGRQVLLLKGNESFINLATTPVNCLLRIQCVVPYNKPAEEVLDLYARGVNVFKLERGVDVAACAIAIEELVIGDSAIIYPYPINFDAGLISLAIHACARGQL